MSGIFALGGVDRSESERRSRFDGSDFVAFRSSVNVGYNSYQTLSPKHQVSVTLSGSARYSACRTNGGPLVVRSDRPGSTSLTPAGSERHGVMEGGRLSFARFEFSSDFLRKSCELDAPPLHLTPLYNVKAEKLCLLAERIIDLLDAKERSHNVLIEGYAVALVRQLVRSAGLSFGRKDDAWMHPQALRRVIDRIEGELDKDLSLGVLAQEAGLSISSLMRAFRGSLGVNVGEYVIRRRVDRAAKLLVTSNIPIAEVARLCGFSTQAHLTNIFRRRHGMPPGAYRHKR